MNFKLIVLGLILVITVNASFAEEQEPLPNWIKESMKLWVDGNISDLEFLNLVERLLNKNILPNEFISEYEYNIVIPPTNGIQETIGGKISSDEYEHVPMWVKNRTQWWIDGKISDEQFLRIIQYLKNVGYIKYESIENSLSNNSFDSELGKYLLNEQDLVDVTNTINWRIISKEYEHNFEENPKVTDSIRITLRDISRVYEPIFYKYKIPSMIIEIIEFDKKSDFLDEYWQTFGKSTEKVFSEAYLTGTPSKNSNCFFNYSNEGAMTACNIEDMIIQVAIFDPYNEYFLYNQDNLVLDNSELTSKILNVILKKISTDSDIIYNSQLHEILQENSFANNEQMNYQSEDTSENLQISKDPEVSKTFGVSNFSCIRDDFGLMTISGKFDNDGMKREKVELIVSLFDAQGNKIGSSKTNLYDVMEFESKRFIGHVVWDKKFLDCKIQAK